MQPASSMQSMAAAKISEKTFFMESPVLYVESCLFYFTRYAEKKQVSPTRKAASNGAGNASFPKNVRNNAKTA